MAHDLQVPQASVGLGIAIFTAAYAVSAPTLSPLAARRSTRLGLLTGLGLFTFGNILTITSSSLPVLLMSRAVAGMGAGIFSPLASSTAANMVDVSQKGRALSTVLGGPGSGTAFGIPVGLAIERWFGWRWTIGLLVLLGLIAAAGVARYRAELPKMRTVDWKARLSALKGAIHSGDVVRYVLHFVFSARSLYLYRSAPQQHALMSNDPANSVAALAWNSSINYLGGAIGAAVGSVLLSAYLAPTSLPLFAMIGVAVAIGIHSFKMKIPVGTAP
jgi:predicted MFS family arabinose efflux permease